MKEIFYHFMHTIQKDLIMKQIKLLKSEGEGKILEMANLDPFTDSGSSESVIEEIRIIRVI